MSGIVTSECVKSIGKKRFGGVEFTLTLMVAPRGIAFSHTDITTRTGEKKVDPRVGCRVQGVDRMVQG